MSTHFGPMTPGLDVDVETGQPSVPRSIAQKAQAQEKRARQLDQRARLVEDLAGPGGEVLRDLAARLAQKIDDLVAHDPEARLLRDILQGTQTTLQVGERVVADDLANIFPRR